jgi:hypothetical protein
MGDNSEGWNQIKIGAIMYLYPHHHNPHLMKEGILMLQRLPDT